MTRGRETETAAPPVPPRVEFLERLRRRMRPEATPDLPFEVAGDAARTVRRRAAPGAAPSPGAAPIPGEGPRATMQIDGEDVVLTTPEGQRYTLPLEKLFDGVGGVGPRLREPPGLVLPRGTRAVRAGSGGFVVAHETPPGIHRLRWIAAGSAAVRGRSAVYREVELALPYLVLVTGIHVDPRGALGFSGWTEAYFSSEPLRSLREPLHFAPLLNVCRSDASGGAVVCMQGFAHAPPATGSGGSVEVDPSMQLHRGLAAVVNHFLHSGFNEDFERVGRMSTFHDSLAKPHDPRLASVEAWEEASARDPGFVLGIPWIPTGRTLEDSLEGVGSWLGILPRAPVRNAALQRVILRNGTRAPERAAPASATAPPAPSSENLP